MFLLGHLCILSLSSNYGTYCFLSTPNPTLGSSSKQKLDLDTKFTKIYQYLNTLISSNTNSNYSWYTKFKLQSQNLVTWQLDGQVSFLRLMFNEFWDWSILVVGLSSRPRLLWRLHYRVTLLVKCYLSPCFLLTLMFYGCVNWYFYFTHTCYFMLIDTFILHTRVILC